MPASLIIVIGWLYVATLAAFTEPSIVGGILTFLFAGALPCGLILYFATSRVRRERRKFQEMQAARKQAAAEAAAANASETQQP
ncbi:MAG: hypothetical protein RIR00_1151 [Pseudomonadota bacterium]|jgi:hypothetical protein